MSLTRLFEANNPEDALVALKMLQTHVKNAKPTLPSCKYKNNSISRSALKVEPRVLNSVRREGGTRRHGWALECVGFRLHDDAYVYDSDAPAEDVDSVLGQAEK